MRTNLAFVARALDHPDFLAGKIDTGFIDRHLAELAAPKLPVETMAAEAAYGLGELDTKGQDPWNNLGFRLNAQRRAPVRVVDEFGVVHESNLVERFTSQALSIIGQSLMNNDYAGPGLHFGGFERDGTAVSFAGGEHRSFRLYEPRGTAVGASSDGAILSPMPGRIIAVEVAAGEAVTKGQKLLTLEAMKMEHSLVAPFDGTVAELSAETGGQVSEGAVLARIERAE